MTATTTLDKCNNSIARILNKGSLKLHSRSLTYTLPKGFEPLAEVTDTTLSLSFEGHTETIELTAHYKSGSLFPHWIKLSKALAALAKRAGNPVLAVPPLELPPTHFKALEDAGFKGSNTDVTQISEELVIDLLTFSEDENNSKSSRNQAAKTADWCESFLPQLPTLEKAQAMAERLTIKSK